MVKYKHMLQVIEQKRSRGGPSWSVESHRKGQLHMVFDRAEMPYVGPQQGLKHLGVIQSAIRYLDERSKGRNPGEHHKAVAGLYKAQSSPRGGKRKAEQNLPEELQLFSDSTGPKKGRYHLDLKAPLPSDPQQVIANRFVQLMGDSIGQKDKEVEPEDQSMVAKEEPQGDDHTAEARVKKPMQDKDKTAPAGAGDGSPP